MIEPDIKKNFPKPTITRKEYLYYKTKGYNQKKIAALFNTSPTTLRMWRKMNDL
ncbi:helix-turn-helix domain-containing protein [Candidatus Enterococcus lemimoniae]|uniref:helix-turn-helix domain-containing protein n=1 Tax=Candidatus Enterococcus lemimoniae TaxID=1834167 RepID=UPI0015937CAF|nr:helix-turn-helix domain-containing protein [Enterococcus sp. 12C11_DIV0727]